MPRRVWSALSLVLMSVALLVTACSSSKPTPTPTSMPTIDQAAVQAAAIATMVARMSVDTTATAQAASRAIQSTATLTAVPTDTPVPTASSDTAIWIELQGMHYETWGSPVNGCKQFDDSQPCRKFQLEVTLHNDTRQKITDWYPQAYSNTGRELLVCFYGYNAGIGFPDVPAGEKRPVTFAVFTNNDEYVRRMKVTALGSVYQNCFSRSGVLVDCP